MRVNQYKLEQLRQILREELRKEFRDEELQQMGLSIMRLVYQKMIQNRNGVSKS